MSDYDYDPIPLDAPQRMSDDALIRSAIAHRVHCQRRTVRHFSDAPIDRSVIEACVRGRWIGTERRQSSAVALCLCE